MIGAIFGVLLFSLFVMISHQAMWFVSHLAVLYSLLSIFFIGGGTLAIKFQRILIIVSTSMGGAFNFMAAIDYFLDQGTDSMLSAPYVLCSYSHITGRAMLLIKSAFHESFGVTPVNCWYTDLVIALLPILFCIGLWVQLKKTSVGHDHRKGTKYYSATGYGDNAMNYGESQMLLVDGRSRM